MFIPRKIVVALLGLLLLVGAGVCVSPYISIYQMRQAAKVGDSEGLSKKVNFPVLRDNIKIKFMSAMNENMKGLEGNLFAGFAQSIVATLVNGMVDTYVSPSGIALMLDGKNPKSQSSIRSVAPAPADQASAVAQDSSSTNKAQSIFTDDQNIKYEYVSFDRFKVSISNTKPSEDRISLIFDREGLFSWKLVDIDFPSMYK